MDPEREGGLLAWQYRGYPLAHRDRRNLLLHLASWPFYLAGTLAAAVGLLSATWLLVPAGLGAMALAMAVQGRGHRMEAAAPATFRGPGDLVLRLFTEQWVTFPRWLLSGGFARAWREAGHGGTPAAARR